MTGANKFAQKAAFPEAVGALKAIWRGRACRLQAMG